MRCGLGQMVPRKGLSGNAHNVSKINDLEPPPLACLYQGNVPLSSSRTYSPPACASKKAYSTLPRPLISHDPSLRSRRESGTTTDTVARDEVARGQRRDLVNARSRIGSDLGNPAHRRHLDADLVGVLVERRGQDLFRFLNVEALLARAPRKSGAVSTGCQNLLSV